MNDLVRKRNELIRASYRIPPNEQAIVLTAISKIDNEISDQVLYELSIQDLCNLTGTPLKHGYSMFKQACFDLFERKITLTNGRKKLTRWVQTIDYEDGAGSIKLRFSHEILPYLTNIKENFTTYNLRHVAKFKSTYGVRIYELLKQWQNTKKHVDLGIDEIKEMFELESKYQRTDSLKTKVIEPAIKDINNHSDLEVSYENLKKGRKIIGFKFRFKTKRKTLTNEFIEQNARAGESWEEARERLKKDRHLPS